MNDGDQLEQKESVEGIQSQEQEKTDSVEEQFNDAEERARGFADKVMADFESLNTGIVNLEEEKIKLGAYTNELNTLTEETSKSLRVKPINRKINNHPELTERSLGRIWEVNGYPNVEKAKEVTAYLSENLFDQQFLGYNEQGQPMYEKIPFKFSESDTEAIKKLIEGIDDPVTFLKKIQSIIPIPSRWELNTFAEYVDTIKNAPSLQLTIEAIAAMGPLSGISIANLTEKGNDPLLTLANLNAEEFKTLFTEDVVTWIKQLNEQQTESEHTKKLRYNPQSEKKPVFSIAMIPDLVSIASSEGRRKMYQELLSSDQYERYFSGTGLEEGTRTFIEFCETFPEVEAVSQLGFDMSRFLSEKYYTQKEREDQRIFFQTLLASEIYKKNLSQFAEAGISLDIQSLMKNSDVMMSLGNPPEIVQKALKLWKNNNGEAVRDLEKYIHQVTQVQSEFSTKILEKYPIDSLLDDVGRYTAKYLELKGIMIACGDDSFEARGILDTFSLYNILSNYAETPDDFWITIRSQHNYLDRKQAVADHFVPDNLSDPEDFTIVLQSILESQESIQSIDYHLTQHNLYQYLSPEDKAKIELIHTVPVPDGAFGMILYRNRDRLDDLLQGSSLTPEFYRLLSQESPKIFTEHATKENWKSVFGENEIKRLLNALPIKTDEKRNAFTHNRHDRTSKLVQRLVETSVESDFELTQQDLVVLTEYVSEYGLSQSPVLFRLYKHLYMFDNNLSQELPLDIKRLGIDSRESFRTQLNEFKNRILNQREIEDVSTLTPLEITLLDVTVGKSSHAYIGVAPMEHIINNFQQLQSNGEIAELKEAYKEITIEVAQVERELGTEAETGISYFEEIRDELLESMDTLPESNLIHDFIAVMEGKLQEIEVKQLGSDGAKLERMQQEVQRFQEYITEVATSTSLDDFVSKVIDMKFDKTEKAAIDSILRRVIFKKIFQGYTSEALFDLRSKIDGEVTAEGLISVLDLIDHDVKDHVLNLQGSNEDEIWDQSVFQKLKASKNGRKLPNIFSTHRTQLQESVEAFSSHEVGKNVIRAIPRRDILGELSGYVANACYTKEEDILANYPELTPYIFVMNENEENSLIGSVLVFEVTDANGNLALLVRALNIPNESGIAIENFTEQFLNSIALIAQQRGAKTVLIPGDGQAISNYTFTNNHMKSSYVTDKQAVSLSDEFNFNLVNLTNNCYVARRIVDANSQG